MTCVGSQKKTVVIGATGFIGSKLYKDYLKGFGNVVGTSRSQGGRWSNLDLIRPNVDVSGWEALGHESVILAAGESNIDYCESNKEETWAINVTGPLELVRQISRTSMNVIYLSSDHVFRGDYGNYDDDAATQPTTEYGRQKAFMEDGIRKITPNHLIIRLSKVYGTRIGDGTLLDGMADSLHKKKQIFAAEDQVICPTHVDDVTECIQKIQAKELRGTFNLCASEHWSRYGLAKILLGDLNGDEKLLTRVKLHDVVATKGRPLNTSMIPSRLMSNVDHEFTSVRHSSYLVAANYLNL